MNMNEQKEEKAAEQGAPVNNNDAGNQGLSIVEEAKKVRDEIKAENDRRENLLKEEQRLHAERMLAGTAGGRIEVPEKIETPKEYADKVMKGEIKAQ